MVQIGGGGFYSTTKGASTIPSFFFFFTTTYHRWTLGSKGFSAHFYIIIWFFTLFLPRVFFCGCCYSPSPPSFHHHIIIVSAHHFFGLFPHSSFFELFTFTSLYTGVATSCNNFFMLPLNIFFYSPFLRPSLVLAVNYIDSTTL